MRPVYQVRTGEGAGQCTEASYASILEVGLEAIPDLYSKEDNGKSVKTFKELHRVMREKFGRKIISVHIDKHVRLPLSGSLMLLTDYLPWYEDFHTILGWSHRGTPHMFVGKAGTPVHDPNHNLVADITVCEGFEFLLTKEQFMNIEWVKEEWWEINAGLVVPVQANELAVHSKYVSVFPEIYTKAEKDD